MLTFVTNSVPIPVVRPVWCKCIQMLTSSVCSVCSVIEIVVPLFALSSPGVCPTEVTFVIAVA